MFRRPPSNTRILVLLAAVLAAGCIERAPTPRSRRTSFKRSGLTDLVLADAPAGHRRVGAVYGDSVELAGIDHAPQTPKPGDKVEVTCVYRVLREADVDYKIFVHLDAKGGRAERINGDHWPASGRYPTGVWRKGEYVRDRWSFTVPSYFDGDALEVWTGFYQPGKDDRWPLTNPSAVRHDGNNRVLAASIPVR
ncbi:MAG TPA: hypothetical protein DFS52_10565 [Myxococcales bacterium]|jgi:hypothetical protein|nr:hypothetical protein [Myxococcales bacterium]